MFESPQAKRICRSKVFDSASSSSSSDEEVTETTTIKEIQDSTGLAYHFDYDLIENGAGEVTKFAHLQVDEPENVLVHEETAPDEEAFEFRLFATQKPANANDPDPDPDPDPDANANGTSATPKRTLNKINIRSPTPDEASDGRFVNPHRPLSYYFTSGAAPPSFAISAVSGLSVLNSSHSPWPGTKLPWRVIRLPSTRLPPNIHRASKSHLAPRAAAAASSRKPSKKRRIQLRTRTKLIDAKAKEREEHLREKKTRLNRERKVKRRAKEKAGKEKEGVGEGGSGG